MEIGFLVPVAIGPLGSEMEGHQERIPGAGCANLGGPGPLPHGKCVRQAAVVPISTPSCIGDRAHVLPMFQSSWLQEERVYYVWYTDV